MTPEIFQIERISAVYTVEARKLYQTLVEELYPAPEAREAFLQNWQAADFESAQTSEDRPIFIALSPQKCVVGLLIGTGLEGGVGTIVWLGVARENRTMSLGRMLLDEAEGFYREIGGHKIKLFCNTESAKRFYERCGYTVEGWHPEHWWRMDCWSVGKSLV